MTSRDATHWHHQLWGTGAHSFFDLQLFNFPGHFMAAQTQTFGSM